MASFYRSRRVFTKFLCLTAGARKVSFATIVATSFMRSITSFAVRQHRFPNANENDICAIGAKRCSSLRSEIRPYGSRSPCTLLSLRDIGLAAARSLGGSKGPPDLYSLPSRSSRPTRVAEKLYSNLRYLTVGARKVSFATLVATSFMRSITSFAVRQHRFPTANENDICAFRAKRCSSLRSEIRPKGSTPLRFYNKFHIEDSRLSPSHFLCVAPLQNAVLPLRSPSSLNCFRYPSDH